MIDYIQVHNHSNSNLLMTQIINIIYYVNICNKYLYETIKWLNLFLYPIGIIENMF